MRAVTVDRYGPPEVAVVRDLPDPTPRTGEVLVRVEAAPVTSGDARMRAGRFPHGFGVLARAAIGFRGPRAGVLGVAFAGVVVAASPEVTTTAVGERVAGMTGVSLGAHAELVRVRADRLTPLPEALSPDAAAAALFGGATALDYLRDRARLASGESVLINGASGAVGSAAVQLARHLGAHVTAVTSDANADLARRLGAERVIDYRQTPVESLADHPERFDVVFDAVGNIRTRTGRALAAPEGRVLLAVATLGETITARGNVIAGPASEKAENLRDVLELAASGDLDPLIERTYRLDDIAGAYARVDTGRKVGSLVLHPGE